ncbi:hypothetical protein Vau01_048780 [Virgisporangium aurantiacum]|uniref:Uncharacterized protein n=1 Tax=Virgisporangium aurantiacum TaxID=175570 RepID=A0A8J3Z5M9_9ACTN|nr:hypothetical protein Vau01_048780 [Virgisporangium aurantiacum]
MLQPNLFQLFQPITGAEIGPGAGVADATAGAVGPTTMTNAAATPSMVSTDRIFMRAPVGKADRPF